MARCFRYIVFVLVLTPCLLLAQPGRAHATGVVTVPPALNGGAAEHTMFADTIKTLKSTAKADGKVKEVTKAKKQPKPEKVDDNNPPKTDAKPKRERRPDGMERPPEIPRRNDN